MFENQTTKEKKISVDQLQVGLFIRLEEHWHNHPFLLNSFKIKNEKQLTIIKQLGIKEITYVPEKSDRPPLPPPKKISAQKKSQDKPLELDPQFVLKKERIAKLNALKSRIAQTAKAFTKTAERVPNLLSSILGGSPEGVQEAQAVVQEMTATLLAASDAVMHLMDAEDKDQELSLHCLNVSILALLLGSAMQLSPQELQSLGLGALLHDLGKMKIEKKHWRKDRNLLSKHEWELVKLHPRYGLEIATKTGISDKQVLGIIAQHHERLDGFGYPAGIKGRQIHKLAKLTTIANIFDNLCNHYDPGKRLCPFRALQLMYKKYDTIIDLGILAFLVKRIGVYPPGTIVKLSNDDLAKVMAVNPNHPLKPLVMPYARGIPSKEAPLIDLNEEPDLNILKAIDPQDLDPEVSKFLKPQARISYFIEQLQEEG